MTLGDKIHQLRKEKGLSQEQLAEVLSNYFKVSTDYLLKDALEQEGVAHQNTAKVNPYIMLVISTAVVFIGLIIGWARANTGVLLEYISFSLAAPGLIIQVIGIASFEIFNLMQGERGKKAPRCLFYGINVWFLAVLPSMYMTAVYLLIACSVTFACVILSLVNRKRS